MPRVSISGLAKSLPFSGFFRKIEQEMETVVRVLQPGPIGIVEHKFSGEEIREADSTVRRAVQNWKMNASAEKRHNSSLSEYID